MKIKIGQMSYSLMNVASFLVKESMDGPKEEERITQESLSLNRGFFSSKKKIPLSLVFGEGFHLIAGNRIFENLRYLVPVIVPSNIS